MLRIVMDSDMFMGGTCVILMGGLRQCPPVLKAGERPDIVSDSIINRRPVKALYIGPPYFKRFFF